MVSNGHKRRIQALKKAFEELKSGKESLLRVLKETEMPELVYNSNAIENSTLTLKETERILLEQETPSGISTRELFEAKNLARVNNYLASKPTEPISTKLILKLHHMLIGGIDDSIAGRFRRKNEYVRVGSHIAPAPEQIARLVEDLLIDYNSTQDLYFLERIAKFHLEFERIHPFNDGNGRIGRVIINVQLADSGFPPIIVRNKGKKDHYYPSFKSYLDNHSTERLDLLLSLAVMESLHKRIAYLGGKRIVRLSDFARQSKQSFNTLLNAARRQTIPAFRERGIWKIGS